MESEEGEDEPAKVEREPEENVEEKVKKPNTFIVKKSRDKEPKPIRKKIKKFFEYLNED